jgi:hypothetical protein
VINRLGNPKPFFPKDDPLTEHAELGMAHGEPGTRARGGQDIKAEALVAPRPVEECRGLRETIHRLTIVTLAPVGLAEAQVRQRVQADLPASRGEHEGALGGGNGLVMRAPDPEIV